MQGFREFQNQTKTSAEGGDVYILLHTWKFCPVLLLNSEWYLDTPYIVNWWYGQLWASIDNGLIWYPCLSTFMSKFHMEVCK